MGHPAFDLSGKVALVTGGNSGIGLGIAEAVAAAGADVAIWGTNEAKNEAARARLEESGRRVLALRCDVGDPAQVAAAFAETVRALGRVDACFANAGISGGRQKPFLEHEVADWERVLRVNLTGAFTTLQTAARHMVERGGGGSLVGTASMPPSRARPATSTTPPARAASSPSSGRSRWSWRGTASARTPSCRAGSRRR